MQDPDNFVASGTLPPCDKCQATLPQALKLKLDERVPNRITTLSAQPLYNRITSWWAPATPGMDETYACASRQARFRDLKIPIEDANRIPVERCFVDEMVKAKLEMEANNAPGTEKKYLSCDRVESANLVCWECNDATFNWDDKVKDFFKTNDPDGRHLIPLLIAAAARHDA